ALFALAAGLGSRPRIAGLPVACRRARSARARARAAALAARGGCAIDLLGHLVRRLLHVLDRRLERLRVGGFLVLFEHVAAALERLFHRDPLRLRNLVAVLVEELLGVVDQRVELVARLDGVAPRL